jgi:hypothetical protein
MAIDPSFVVNLKGKDYLLYQGVVDAATQAGLRKMSTQIVQIPSAENNHMAVVLVTAEFEDGRVFQGVGDASPANCSPHIATAALRMAETRAGGRALRLAINCAMTLKEELPDEEAAGSLAPAPSADARQQSRAVANGQKAAAASGGAAAVGTSGRADVVPHSPAAAPAVSGDVPTPQAPPPTERLCPLCTAEGKKRYLTESQYLNQANLGRVPVCKQHEEERLASA